MFLSNVPEQNVADLLLDLRSEDSSLIVHISTPKTDIRVSICWIDSKHCFYKHSSSDGWKQQKCDNISSVAQLSFHAAWGGFCTEAPTGQQHYFTPFSEFLFFITCWHMFVCCLCLKRTEKSELTCKKPRLCDRFSPYWTRCGGALQPPVARMSITNKHLKNNKN